MTTFTIDTENNITAYHPETPVPDTISLQLFTSEKTLAEIAAYWPAFRLVEIWNNLTGVVPVKKFTDRKSAAARIWKQIQHLTPAPAPEAQKAAVKKAKPVNGATRGDNANTAREGSKKATVLELLRRPAGASLAEIMTETGWQAHTVRGFISGTLTKKLGLTVESLRGEDKVRTYRIAE